ncbi:MAG: ATP-binding cassette domain-containing protein, partial [Myxococcota bacterium]|nr:ATP-binding cassette domain-containing protein [Myxococcota bacterium]
GYVRGHLARVLFTQDEVHKRIANLSGGEAARLIFAKLAVTQPNTLVLDEPTNHLDLEGIGSLARALCNYEGTVLFVSHDRWFVSEVATRIVEITPEGIQDFRGAYEEYLLHCADDHLDADAAVRRGRRRRGGAAA